MNTLFRTITCCNDNPSFTDSPLPLEEPLEQTIISVRDLALMMFIGVYDFEHANKQRVVVNVEAGVTQNRNWKKDDIRYVFSYEDIVNAVQDIASRGHIQLVETFAEEIAGFCLHDKRVKWAKVSVEKMDICPEARSVGVTIVRHQPATR